MIWQFASALAMGDRNEQQDRVAVLHSEENDSHLLVVADGMGGHEGGAIAAQTVIDIASSHFNNGMDEAPKEFLEKICFDAHDKISELAGNYASAPGSTCVILYLKGDEAYCIHAGDSRLYQYNDGSLIYKTADHSMAELVKEHGAYLKDDSNYSTSQNQLYMCLGGTNTLKPDFHASKVKAGDFFVLCSDGFWDQLDVGEVFAGTSSAAMDLEHTEHLVQMASQQGQGKSDNVCLALAYCQDAAEKSERPRFFKQLANWLP